MQRLALRLGRSRIPEARTFRTRQRFLHSNTTFTSQSPSSLDQKLGYVDRELSGLRSELHHLNINLNFQVKRLEDSPNIQVKRLEDSLNIQVKRLRTVSTFEPKA